MASINSRDIDINHASSRSTVNKRKKHNEFAYIKDKRKKHNYADQEFWKSKKNIQFHRQSRRDNFVGDCVWRDAEMPSQVPANTPQSVATITPPVVAPPPPPPADVPAYGVSVEPCFTETMVNENAGRATKVGLDLLTDRIVREITELCESCGVHCGVMFFEELNLWRCTVFDAGLNPRRFEIRVWQRFSSGTLSVVVTRTSGGDLDGGAIGADYDGRCFGELGRNEKLFRSFCKALECEVLQVDD